MAYTLNPSVALPYSEGTQFTPNDSNGVVNYSSGYFEMDGTTPVAVVVPIGFHPRKIRVVDMTSFVQYELLDFMQTITPNSTIKTVTGGGVTIDTTGAITVGTDAAGTERTFTVAASILTASHNYVFEAIA
jgi:hypothetical protein